MSPYFLHESSYSQQNLLFGFKMGAHFLRESSYLQQNLLFGFKMVSAHFLRYQVPRRIPSLADRAGSPPARSPGPAKGWSLEQGRDASRGGAVRYHGEHPEGGKGIEPVLGVDSFPFVHTHTHAHTHTHTHML